MTYLDTKKRAYCMINSMFKEGKKPSVIVFTIQNEFGFGSKMVDMSVMNVSTKPNSSK